MQKKEEFESGRLMDFEFRQRVRATRLFARKLGVNEAALVEEIALQNADDLLGLVAQRMSHSRVELASIYAQCLGDARQQLIDERGNPAPNRLG